MGRATFRPLRTKHRATFLLHICIFIWLNFYTMNAPYCLIPTLNELNWLKNLIKKRNTSSTGCLKVVHCFTGNLHCWNTHFSKEGFDQVIINNKTLLSLKNNLKSLRKMSFCQIHYKDSRIYHIELSVLINCYLLSYFTFIIAY